MFLKSSTAYTLSPRLTGHLYFSLPTDFLQKKTIGAKEESGFTEGCLANPIVEKLASQVLPVALVSSAVLPKGQMKHHVKDAAKQTWQNGALLLQFFLSFNNCSPFIHGLPFCHWCLQGGLKKRVATIMWSKSTLLDHNAHKNALTPGMVVATILTF